MARYVPKPVAVKELVAAAFAAQRILGGLNKNEQEWSEDEQRMVNLTTNKSLVLKHVDGNHIITQADYELAETAKDAILLANTLRILKGGKPATGFQDSMYKLLELETTTVSSAGLAVYIPNMYNQLKRNEEKQEKIAELSVTSEYLGKIGDKVTFSLSVMSSRFLQQYNCFSVTGTDEKGNLIQFLTAKEECTKSGKYSGKVKRVEESQYHNGAKVTNFNFVKQI